jgi:hypothetical protein
MPEYRFYRIDRRGHRLGPPEVADCANDDEAVAHAKRILTGYVLEVVKRTGWWVVGCCRGSARAHQWRSVSGS